METSSDTWREVQPDAIGLAPRAFCRSRGGIVWWHDRNLAGLVVTDASADGLSAMAPAFWRLAAAGEQLDLVSDLRRVSLGPDTATVLAASFAGLERLVERFARSLRRHAGVLAPDWARAFWKALSTCARAPWQSEAVADPADAWDWLGVASDVRDDVERALADIARQPREGRRSRGCEPQRLSKLTTLVRAEPSLTIVEAARRMGASPRSLQRELTAAGESFVALRSRIRMELTLTLLDDHGLGIKAIASRVGFASPAHFAHWFRRMRGVTPSRHRDARTTRPESSRQGT